MPGMNSGVTTNDPVLEAAFRVALLRQFGVVLAIFLALLLAYGLLRLHLPGGRPPVLPDRRRTKANSAEAYQEPSARRWLRVSFGILWIIDGILQAQPEMAAGLPSQVVQPAASASPGWVQAVTNAGGTIWSFHPVEAAAAATWIQLGLGLWLLAAPKGWSSRLAGLGTVAWGLVVWVFGESFGGIFAPGLSWLSGAPGAVVLYIVAGALLALPARAWAGQRLGRLLLGGTGVFWLGLALLQAWPGRGYWQGGEDGSLSSMVSDMAGLTQPGWQARMINGVALLCEHDALAVNLVAVLGLTLTGGGLLSAAVTLRARLLRVVVPVSIAFCLVVWVFIQDFGIPGGLGTDPNSMIPWLLLLWTGYRAVTASPVAAEAAQPSRVRRHLSAAGLRKALSGATAGSLTSLGAFGVVLVGVAPLALATATPHADPLIARSISGAAVPVNRPAPDFHLVSQAGQPVSLASLGGKVTLLTFLDPKCTADCPVATELKEAGQLLGGADGQVRFVAIAASQSAYDPAHIRALDRADGLDTVPNWLFLTGSLPQLEAAWGRYGIFVSHMAPGASSVMTDLVFVIDSHGQIRQEIRDNPGPGTISTRSSFAMLLANAARQVLADTR